MKLENTMKFSVAGALCCSMLWPLIALAQDEGLEEVIVTAQKRSQSIQDVGISIVAFDSDTIEENRLFSAEALTDFVPNMELSMGSDSDIPVFVIRGVGLQDYNPNNTPTTALVVDDVYQPFGVYGTFALFDAERVEVLRGPQGGLYGRNSTGGAINIASKKPSFEQVEGNIAADAGDYGQANMRGAISVPFSDVFAARLAAQYESSDGYYYNTFLQRDQGGADRLQTRLTLSFEPTESFAADLRVIYGYNNPEVSIPELNGYLDPNFRNPGPLVGFGSPDMNVPFDDEGNPVYCAAVLATGIPDATCVTANGFTPDGDIFSGEESFVRKHDDTFNSTALNLQFDFDRVSLVSVTSFAELDLYRTNGTGKVGIAAHQNPDEWAAYGEAVGRANGSVTGNVADPNYTTDYDSEISSWSQEFRLLSSGDSAVSWMVGAVYAEDELIEDRNCFFPANLYFDYAVFPGCGVLRYDQDTEMWSAYGQVAFELGDRFRLTIDARYTNEKKTYEGGVWINDGAWTCTLFGLSLTDCEAFVGYDPVTNLFPLATGAMADYDESNPSYKVNLDYTLSDDVLMYLSVGETFKSGGFFGGFFFSPDAVVAYEPETNFAVELGVKSTLADGRMRLNAAVFRYDYADFQGNLNAQSSTAGGGAVFSGLTNLGDVETTGLEADLQWLPVDGLTLSLGLGWLDTEITAVADPGFTDPDVVIGVTNILAQVVPIIGNELNDAPRFSGNAIARYQFGLTSSLDAALQVDANWSDDYYLSVSNEPYSEEEGVTIVNARAQIMGGDEASWSVAIWGRNLTDEVFRTSTLDDGVFSNYSNWSRPRTYGITASYRF